MTGGLIRDCRGKKLLSSVSGLVRWLSGKGTCYCLWADSLGKGGNLLFHVNSTF